MPLRGAAYRPVLAQGPACDTMAFACARPAGDAEAKARAAFADLAPTCDTFPLNWPSPVAAGPFFFGRAGQEKTFPIGDAAVTLIAITTNDRGISCGRFWQWAYWPCPFQGVYKTIFSAVWLAQVRARPLPMLRAAIWRRALFWAAFSAPFATILTFAANRRISEKSPLQRPSGHSARLAFFAFAPRALACSWP